MDEPRQLLKDHFRRRDLLGNVKFKQTHLYASFYGIRQAFKKFFKVTDLPFVHNNEVKIMQRQDFEPTYPYSYISVNSIGNSQDHMTPATLRRHGVGHSVSLSNATVTKHYYFPIDITLEMHYVTNDTLDAFRFMSEALVLISAKALSFSLTNSDGVKGFVTIKADTQQIELPKADKENEADPETHDIVLTFTVSSWTGTSKEVAKINNDGKITFDAIIMSHTGEQIDEEVTEIVTADRT